MTMPMRRTIKNVVKNYSDAQIKVREATSNDPWGPSSTLMSEIADLTYNVLAFTEIMQMVWKRLNDHGKNWRHVYKSLVLLDYIVKTGSEKVAQQCKENIFAIQTLKDFQYIEDAKDQGLNVREKAKQLVSLLKDDDRLKNERAKALKAKERFALTNATTGGGLRLGSNSPTPHSSLTFSESIIGGGGGGGGYSEFGSPSSSSLETAHIVGEADAVLDSELEAARPTSTGEEELQLQLALVMSQEEHEEEMKRQLGDEVKLQMAIEQSKKDQPTAAAPLGKPQVTLLDIGTFDTPAPAMSFDPWMTTPRAADPWASVGSTAVVDPWASSPSQSCVQKQTMPASGDPWIGNLDPMPVWAPSSSPCPSPWESPAKSQMQTLSAANAGAIIGGGGGGEMDDEFDLLSTSRSKSPSISESLSQQQQQQQPGMLLPSTVSTPQLSLADTSSVSGGTGSNPWDMAALGQSLVEPPNQSANQPARRKSPKEFLGENASLVNLDNLVAQPASTTNMNPFAALGSTNRSPSPAVNPFAAQQQAGRSTPLNQMPVSHSTPVQGVWGGPPMTQTSPNITPMYAAGSASSYPPAYNPFL